MKVVQAVGPLRQVHLHRGSLALKARAIKAPGEIGPSAREALHDIRHWVHWGTVNRQFTYGARAGDLVPNAERAIRQIEGDATTDSATAAE
jgi:hypothetical protein